MEQITHDVIEKVEENAEKKKTGIIDDEWGDEECPPDEWYDIDDWD